MYKTRYFFFSSRRRHTICGRDWSSDVCSSDLKGHPAHATSKHPAIKRVLKRKRCSQIYGEFVFKRKIVEYRVIEEHEIAGVEAKRYQLAGEQTNPAAGVDTAAIAAGKRAKCAAPNQVKLAADQPRIKQRSLPVDWLENEVAAHIIVEHFEGGRLNLKGRQIGLQTGVIVEGVARVDDLPGVKLIKMKRIRPPQRHGLGERVQRQQAPD